MSQAQSFCGSEGTEAGVLREFAELTKDVVLIGVGARVEIWSKERWDGTANFDDMEDIAEHMAELGLSI